MQSSIQNADALLCAGRGAARATDTSAACEHAASRAQRM
jgi:hypothetical protein